MYSFAVTDYPIDHSKTARFLSNTRLCMRRRVFVLFLLLLAGVFALRAQDHPVSLQDGRVVKPDTSKRTSPMLPQLLFPVFPSTQVPSFLSPMPDLFKTKEQRAARVNAMTSSSIMTSLDRNLAWYRPLKLPKPAKWALFAGKFFLSNPFAYPKGAVPVMNASNPFIFAYVPGWAPYESPYSPDCFPQSIRLEFDFTTGTYKQVMVKWDEVQKNFSTSFGSSSQQYAPIPTDPLRPAYWNTP